MKAMDESMHKYILVEYYKTLGMCRDACVELNIIIYPLCSDERSRERGFCVTTELENSLVFFVQCSTRKRGEGWIFFSVFRV